VTYIIASPVSTSKTALRGRLPVDCIHEFDRVLVIDRSASTAGVRAGCPVEAIFPEDALPDPS
jgi:hypothetical protein